MDFLSALLDSLYQMETGRKTEMNIHKIKTIPAKYWLLIAIFSLLSVLLSFLFYWFQIRPSRIRQSCYDQTFREESSRRLLNKYGDREQRAWGKEWMADPNVRPDAFRDIWPEWGWYYPSRSTKTIEYLYDKCLLKHGMKAEEPIFQ